jgi:hypothetical protein
MSNVKDVLLLTVSPVCKDANEDVDYEKYKYILVKFLYKNNGQELNGRRYIQEITDIELIK